MSKKILFHPLQPLVPLKGHRNAESVPAVIERGGGVHQGRQSIAGLTYRDRLMLYV